MTDDSVARSFFFLNLEQTDGLLDMARGEFTATTKASTTEPQLVLMQQLAAALVQPLMPTGFTIDTLPPKHLVEGHLGFDVFNLTPLAVQVKRAS